MNDDAPIAINCSECDVLFYITARYKARRLHDHNAFYCPNGHDQHYPAATVGDVRDLKASFDKPHLTSVKP